ncbi:hypothetical protein HanXRQr2_Chr11g0472251 [Helianthus annuus]|uniref:Uncharacterized protein n=1 Tax=Helianthus annuus TaxID=4232 RepID=A0A9K3MYM3_HELAN|nr:hypothetical protein HanXRQr2_Chr11g0472251 [Helianthus annuus]KAJ0873699.1 hypothetical protein HanPSC8_Chr11g0455491 [Helianthus annuus]
MKDTHGDDLAAHTLLQILEHTSRKDILQLLRFSETIKLPKTSNSSLENSIIMMTLKEILRYLNTLDLYPNSTG